MNTRSANSAGQNACTDAVHVNITLRWAGSWPPEARCNVPRQESIPQLKTPGVMAADLGEPLHRVLHVLRTRQHIRPSARAGRLRLYNREAVAMVRHELNCIDARRNAKEGER